MNSFTESALVRAIDNMHALRLVKEADAASRRVRKLYQQGGERGVQRALGDEGLAALERARYGAARARAPKSSTATAAFAPQRAAPPSRASAAPSVGPTKVQRYKQLMAERAQWAKTDQRAVNASNYGMATPEQQRIASRVLRDRQAAQAQADAAKAAQKPKFAPQTAKPRASAPSPKPAPSQAAKPQPAAPKSAPQTSSILGGLRSRVSQASRGMGSNARLLGAAALGATGAYGISRLLGSSNGEVKTAGVRALRRLADEVFPVG